jgi:hypothetical protein
MQELPARLINNSLDSNPESTQANPESSNGTSTPEEGNDVSPNGKRAGAIAGGVIGAVLLVAVAVALWHLKCRKRSSPKRQSPSAKTTVRFPLDADLVEFLRVPVVDP